MLLLVLLPLLAFDMKQTIIYSIHVLSVLTLLTSMTSCHLKREEFLWSIDYDVNGKHQSYCEYSTPESRYLDRDDPILNFASFDGKPHNYSYLNFPQVYTDMPTCMFYAHDIAIKVSKKDLLPFKIGEVYTLDNATIQALYKYILSPLSPSGSFGKLAEQGLLSAEISMSQYFKWGVGDVVDIQFEFEEVITNPDNTSFKEGDIIKVTNGHLIQKMYDYINNYITK